MREKQIQLHEHGKFQILSLSLSSPLFHSQQ